MLLQKFELIKCPSQFPRHAFALHQGDKKALLLWSNNDSLEIDLMPLFDTSEKEVRCLVFSLRYFRGKRQYATTRVSGSVLPVSYDPNCFVVTLPIREPVVFRFVRVVGGV